MRQYVRNRYTYLGNGNKEVDALAARLLSDFADICHAHSTKDGYCYPGGVSTFGRQLEWAPNRLATPSGHKKGEVLAANCSPTPGTDRQGATAVIQSYCAADLSKLSTGAALDVRLHPSALKGEEGLDALVSLIRAFVLLGGFFMQLDVVDAAQLREAQERPEEFRTLAVRVSGWSARFVTLSREWQEMVIAQNEHPQ